MFWQLFTTNHEHKDFLLLWVCTYLEAKAERDPLLPVDKHTKAPGWGTTLSKTHADSRTHRYDGARRSARSWLSTFSITAYRPMTIVWSYVHKSIFTSFVPLTVCGHSQGVYFPPTTGGGA